MDSLPLSTELEDPEKLHRILQLINIISDSLLQEEVEPLMRNPSDVSIAVVLFAAQFMKRSGMGREQFSEFAKQAWDAHFDGPSAKQIDLSKLTFPDQLQ